MNSGDESVIHAGIKILMHEIRENAIAHGFEDKMSQTYFKKLDRGPDLPPLYEEVDLSNEFAAQQIALEHSELSEALEGMRKRLMDQHCPQFTSEEIESADAIIRIFHRAARRNLRLPDAILSKMSYNAKRERMHGGKAF